jgi:glyoxylase-like metal-dependent hydrolase (beta-lactamase superfamily II)
VKIGNFVISLILVSQFASIAVGQNKNTGNYLEVGELKVHKLQDAQIFLQISTLAGIEKDEAKKLVGSDSAWTPVNTYLIKTKNHTVLIDAGIGIYPGEDSGHLIDQMKKTGIKPENIDLILITHFHFDHISGLISPEGKKLFPNAVVRASQAESDFWMRDSSLIPVNLRKRAARIKSILEPYVSAKAYIPLRPDEDLGDGIKALPAYGHTPGHTVYTFSSKGKTLWCVGDLIHFGSVQFAHPKVSLVFDSNTQMAVTSRIDLFKRAAVENVVLAATHLPDMVKLVSKGDSFTATPAEAR